MLCVFEGGVRAPEAPRANRTRAIDYSRSFAEPSANAVLLRSRLHVAGCYLSSICHCLLTSGTGLTIVAYNVNSAPRHLPMEELEAGLDHILSSPRDHGRLELIVRRPRREEREVLEAGELHPS